MLAILLQFAPPSQADRFPNAAISIASVSQRRLQTNRPSLWWLPGPNGGRFVDIFARRIVGKKVTLPQLTAKIDAPESFRTFTSQPPSPPPILVYKPLVLQNVWLTTQASLPRTICYQHVCQIRRSLKRLTVRPLAGHIRTRKLPNLQQIRLNREVGWPLTKQLGPIPQRPAVRIPRANPYTGI